MAKGFLPMNTQLILSMHKNGIGIKKIAAILNTTECEVYRCLYDNGFTHFASQYAERDTKIREAYENGENITSIARTLCVDRHTVTDVLRRMNIYKGNRNGDMFSEEKATRNKKAIDLYKNGMSLSQVSKEIGVCSSTVAKILRAYKIDTRPQHLKGHSKGTSKNRKYSFDINFFQEINSEEKAYWLGFLYADGYVGCRGITTLCLQEKDLEHIEAFRASLGDSSVPIKYRSRTKSYAINLSSVKMAEDLIKLGCVQRKSLILTFPSERQVPRDLIRHFMRGYFDGDGCISGDKSPTFSVLGTPAFLDEYEKILLHNCKNQSKTKRTHRKDWNNQTENIAYGGVNRVLEIYDFLYKDATIYLERKKERFEKIKASRAKLTRDSG